ncbi:MAG: hypothetical protein IJ295_03230 [Clostridia bacterium]|nr:hypothetical protein [Clostridia bacterium]
MKWYVRLICVVIIIVGVFSFINLSNVWSKESAVVGSPTTIESQNNYDLVFKQDYGVVTFETEDYVNYVNKSAFADCEFDGLRNEYRVLVNDKLLTDVEVTAGQIKGVYLLNYYLTNGEVGSTAKLDISISFYDDKTEVTISMKNENDSYAYLNRYMGKNGFILKVVKGVTK